MEKIQTLKEVGPRKAILKLLGLLVGSYTTTLSELLVCSTTETYNDLVPCENYVKERSNRIHRARNYWWLLKVNAPTPDWFAMIPN